VQLVVDGLWEVALADESEHLGSAVAEEVGDVGKVEGEDAVRHGLTDNYICQKMSSITKTFIGPCGLTKCAQSVVECQM
jgi:hypothetical protein